jgi:hypothetical protein
MRAKAVASFVVALMISTSAWSTVIISNDSVNDALQTIFPGTGGIQGTKGMGFTMGPLAFQLDSVDLRLCFDNVAAGCFPAANGSVGTPVLRLFSDIGGLPSNELLTFTNPVFGFGIEDYSFVPAAPFTLIAGTAYWLVLHSGDGGDFSWLTNDPQTLPAGAFASHLGMTTGGDAPEPPTSSSTFLNIYAVHGTQAVPEPATALLLLAGLAWSIWRSSMLRTKTEQGEMPSML